MKFTEYGLFKLGKFILFLGLVFMSFVSYGEVEKSLSEEQSLEQQMTEMNSLEMSKGEEDLSNQAGASILSVKGELGAALIGAFLPLSLEFHTPVIMESNQLKWLTQAGVGGFFPLIELSFREEVIPYVSVDTGLRYDFPFQSTISIMGGVAFHSEWQLVKNTEPSIATLRGILSVGQKFANTHIALNAGCISSVGNPYTSKYIPFLSLSVSLPIKKW